MKNIPILLLLTLCIQCQNNSQLSTKQKVEDFEYLYQILDENYPFFGTAKRKLNIEWLSNKENYLERIKATPNDSAYFMTLTSIVNELNCPHLGIGPTLSHKKMLDVYKRATIEQPKYAKWVDVLEKSERQFSYWQEICKSTIKGTEYKDQTIQTVSYSDSLLVKDKIAIMRIKSFFYDNLANDSISISSFLGNIQNYNHLIIDIQDNFGGSSNYWKKYIVGKLSDAQIIFQRNQIIKDGNLNKHFYPDFFEKGVIATKQNTSFQNTPDEIIDNSFYIYSHPDTIIPNNPFSFNGEIYVLVNNNVVSASDDFTYFCKISRWATVAGIRTMGEGNCGEPTLFRLPNSGIVFKHPSAAGLNEDGSLNFETQTTPSIEISANSSNERLEKLINYIKKDKIRRNGNKI